MYNTSQHGWPRVVCPGVRVSKRWCEGLKTLTRTVADTIRRQAEGCCARSPRCASARTAIKERLAALHLGFEADPARARTRGCLGLDQRESRLLDGNRRRLSNRRGEQHGHPVGRPGAPRLDRPAATVELGPTQPLRDHLCTRSRTKIKSEEGCECDVRRIN